MTNVIFLDIDGVLNHGFPETEKGEVREDGLIEQDKVKLLAGLVEEADAKLILHSGWRFWFDETMKPLHKNAEILVLALANENLALSGKTPDLTTPEIRKTKKFSRVKASEILLWVKMNTPENWIVLDDLPLHSAEIEKHQIQVDGKTGLTVQDINRAKVLFGRADGDWLLT